MFRDATSVGTATPAFATETRHFCVALQTMWFAPNGPFATGN